jgi:hypothetical protein
LKFKKYINHLTRANGARIAALVCSLCLCFTCLTGCAAAAATTTQPTLEELMAEVNAAHQSVERGDIDPTPYLRTDISASDLQSYVTTYYGKAESGEYEAYDGTLELTVQQAREDVEYLFETLYHTYVLYDYFGGKEAFDAAETAILQELETKQSLTCDELADIMLPYFEFVKDEHFTINFKWANWCAPRQADNEINQSIFSSSSC